MEHKKKKEEAEDNHPITNLAALPPPQPTTTQPTPTQTIWTVDNPPQSWPKIHGKLNQNQRKQLENPTQNQAKLTKKSNSKIVQTHRKTQLKINSNPPKNHPKPKSKPKPTENPHEKPNGAVAAALLPDLPLCVSV